MKEINVDGIIYVPKEEKQLADNYVIIRTCSAGVHAGELVKHNGKEVELADSRRIWKWSGAMTLSEMAMNGVTDPNNCKFGCPVTKIVLTEAIEIITCTDKAQSIIKGVPEWKK